MFPGDIDMLVLWCVKNKGTGFFGENKIYVKSRDRRCLPSVISIEAFLYCLVFYKFFPLLDLSSRTKQNVCN